MWRHGRFSREHVELRRAIKALAREARATMRLYRQIQARHLLARLDPAHMVGAFAALDVASIAIIRAAGAC